MMTAMFGAAESGVIYAIMALGVYLSFRVLDFPDLTVDGSFVTGGAVASIMIVNGSDPFTATIVALFAGFLAGCATGILHTKGGINPLLSGILMMIALYSINLRIMGKPNVPLLAEETVMTKITNWFASEWSILLFMLLLTLIIKVVTDLFLKTEVGLSLRAVGDNEGMVRSFSANTGWMKVLGLGLSNALVAFSGALVAQYNGFNDVGMGIGMIVIGLASVIIGEAVIGHSSIARATLAVVVGAILYRMIVTLALRIEFLDTGDMKLITAVIVIIALVLPKVLDRQKAAARKKKRLQQLGGSSHA
ncbi:ABC transporter permease [Domibacillus sp. DTU_2020_1001157_1_SI_ALB_TIR_016]|uniref:ABC transporter permease n=1 Tax=Domibacillus sp. DTU_2020_1001157_1_SI_ALB_TIR_016 TaxID=3077789 RepID=UPI0028E60A41|nr:ABC transporter permease [Domibacillus sp. DTU_2020_1001157_1_SI_ALB_TIR_016]WNS82156.1 ABC transporter permease [Domibacillus sp. DTU_2020_1001157_1_SI_ALB_TIR_016]